MTGNTLLTVEKRDRRITGSTLFYRLSRFLLPVSLSCLLLDEDVVKLAK